ADRGEGAPQVAQPEPGPRARDLRPAAVAKARRPTGPEPACRRPKAGRLEERDAREPGEGASQVAAKPRREAPARGALRPAHRQGEWSGGRRRAQEGETQDRGI